MSEAQTLLDLGLFPVTDPEVTQCVMYLCNLAFSDVLDVCKNQKFPGALAVSLSRDTLPRLNGQPGHHVPYEATDLLSWTQPLDRVIPPLQLTQVVGKTSSLGGLKSTSAAADQFTHRGRFDAKQLDFGDACQSGFEVPPVMCLCPFQLDFGGPDGLFWTS